MLGAIIGDTVGSVYECDSIKTTEFPLFSRESSYTDDSVMSVAVADWLLRDSSHSFEELECSMVSFAQKYPCPVGGYGAMFYKWLFYPEQIRDTQRNGVASSLGDILRRGIVGNSKVPNRHPYNSYGNGSAMRVSAVGWMFDTLEETTRVAKISAEITHNHPEGVKGAQATSAAIFMARKGKTKEDIRSYIEDTYGYDLDRECDEIRPTYCFEDSCQETVPQAIIAFLDSSDFESAIRLAVSLGGDSDTLACITGGIAEAFYKEIPQPIVEEVWQRLPDDFKDVLRKMEQQSEYKLPRI